MIQLDVVYQNCFVEVQVNRMYSYIQIAWLQQPTSEVYRKEVALITNYITAHNLFNILFDVRRRQYVELADQNWLGRKIFPLIKNREKIRFAYLVTQEGYELMDTYQIHGLVLNKYEFYKHVDLGIFMHLKEAQDWLLNYGNLSLDEVLSAK